MTQAEGSGSESARPKRPGEAPPQIAAKATPGYYDVPMLKAPVWTWEVPTYFFFGGLSGGAFAVGRLAERFGGRSYRDVARLATIVSATAFVPCPPLLIADLGDPKRFIYMLRVFKPKSPMNLGSWILTGFSGALAIAVVREIALGRRAIHRGGTADVALAAVGDIAGIPLALGLMGYTGVLLSTTSTPIWARNNWLGPLFMASAFSAGASAVDLAVELKGGVFRHKASATLGRLETACHLAEAAALTGFLAASGEHAEPLRKGPYSELLYGGAVGLGLLAPTLLKHLPVTGKSGKRAASIMGPILGLAGGLALRLAITRAGIPSANNPQSARTASRRR